MGLRKGLMTLTMDKRIGGLTIKRGNHPQYGDMVMWDHVPDCRSVDCPAYRKCHYVTKDMPGEVCHVVKDYQRVIVERIYKTCGTELTATQSMRVGLELLPLFKLLIRLKLEEAGVVEVSYITPKGMRMVSPIFKEIRDTVKAIEGAVSSIGLHDLDLSLNFSLGGKTMKDPYHPGYQVLRKAGEGGVEPVVPAKSYYEMLEGSSSKEPKAKPTVELRRRGAA